MDNDLWLSAMTHREQQRRSGKYRCTYKRTTIKFDVETGQWTCGECGIHFTGPDAGSKPEVN